MELLTIWMLATLLLGALLFCYFLKEGYDTRVDALQNTIVTLLTEAKDERLSLQAERKDLYDRLMAGTLPQYKEHAPDDDTSEEEENPLIDLEDAKEELMNG